MKTTIRNLALELGFEVCHFTSAAPPESADKLQDWLDSGRHGTMEYLRRNAPKRSDPELVLPGARSIIALAASYSMPEHGAPKEGDSHEDSQRTGGAELNSRARLGNIARYARFKDYHHVLGERLKELTRRIHELAGPETRSLWYVDTGPILERDLAQRAGLGFVGKHTNLISRGLGNWFFIAEILTTLELAPDLPERNRCGSCTRCLSACPTQAITAPFQLDARRCISYLTIELKGPIPIELRSAIGNRIYGCDDCLLACPWNRFAREGKLMREHARPDLEAPDLLELLALDDAEFKRRFADTPIYRTKRRGLLRNVCVALGNAGERAALPALKRATSDPDLLIAEHAAWAIGEIEGRPERENW